MLDKKQILVSSLIEQIYSHTTKHCEFTLLTPNLVAVQAKLHVETQVFANELIFIDELKFIDGEIHVCTTEEGRYAIPRAGTISVSLEN